MKLEETDGELGNLGTRIFTMVEQITGYHPTSRATIDGYKVASHVRAFLYIHLVGRGARKWPANSILLRARWHKELTSLATKGNNWWGKESATVVVTPRNADQLAKAKDFIRSVYGLHGR